MRDFEIQQSWLVFRGFRQALPSESQKWPHLPCLLTISQREFSTIRYFRRGAFRRHVETLEKLARFYASKLARGKYGSGYEGDDATNGRLPLSLNSQHHPEESHGPFHPASHQRRRASASPTHVPCARPRLSPDSERRHSGRLRIEPPITKSGEQCASCHSDGRAAVEGTGSASATETGLAFAVESGAGEVYLCTAALTEDGTVIPSRDRTLSADELGAVTVSHRGSMPCAPGISPPLPPPSS